MRKNINGELELKIGSQKKKTSQVIMSDSKVFGDLKVPTQEVDDSKEPYEFLRPAGR